MCRAVQKGYVSCTFVIEHIDDVTCRITAINNIVNKRCTIITNGPGCAPLDRMIRFQAIERYNVISLKPISKRQTVKYINLIRLISLSMDVTGSLLQYICVSYFVLKIGPIRLGFSSQKQKILYLDSQPTDS